MKVSGKRIHCHNALCYPYFVDLSSGQGLFVTSHFGDIMASVTWPAKVSTRRVDQIDQITDKFEENSIFVLWLSRFAPFAK